jgi:hypothetical protein
VCSLKTSQHYHEKPSTAENLRKYSSYLVILRRSRKLGDPARRGIEGERERLRDATDLVECDAELEWLPLRLVDRLEADERDLELLELPLELPEDDRDSERDLELL